MNNPQDVQKFGERLKRLREKAGLTQETLAYEAGISARTIQRIEANKAAVTIDLFFSLTRALQLQPSEFFKGFTIEIEK